MTVLVRMRLCYAGAKSYDTFEGENFYESVLAGFRRFATDCQEIPPTAYVPCKDSYKRSAVTGKDSCKDSGVVGGDGG